MKLISLFTILLGIALCSASLLGDYQPCTETEVNDDQEIKKCLDYGTTQLYDIAVQDNQVQNSSYQRDDSATKVYKQPTSGGNAYTCKVAVKNDYGDTVEGSCTVYYDQASGSMSLTDYSYAVKCQGEENSSADQGDYAPVDDNEQSSYTVQDCVNYGAKETLQKAYDNKKISGSGYKIVKVNSVEKKTDSSGTYYKCNVDCTNYDDCAVNMNYNVYYPSSGQKKLESYTYDVQKIAKQPQPTQSDYQELTPNQYDFQVNADVQDCLNYGLENTLADYKGYTVSNVNGVYKYDVPDNKNGECYYKYDIGLNDNSADKTATSSIVVWYNPSTQEKKLKAFSCNTQKNGYSSGGWSGSSTSSTYTKLSTSDVTSNSKYSGVLKYGMQECLKSLYNNNVISDTSGYTINGIQSALYKQDNGGESYKFRVSCKNSIGVSLNADYDVNYDTNSGKKTMTWYSVKGGSPVNYGDVLIADYNSNSQNQNDYEVDVGNYAKIPPSDLDMYPDVQDTVNYGIKETVKNAAQNEGVSSDYKVKEIRNVCRDNDNSANYRVDATVTDSSGKDIDCSCSVNNENGNQLTGYTYAVY